MQTNPSPRLDGVLVSIQFLRGIAAMMVVWHHALEQMPGLKSGLFTNVGALGVDLFFVLSGLIMGVTAAGRATTPSQFVARRIIRIVPLYWAVTLAITIGALAFPALFRTTMVTWSHLLQSLFFVPHWSPSHPGHAWPILVPGWSLNFEMFFYLVFAVSLSLPQKLRLGALLAVFAGLVGIGALFGPFQSAVAESFTSHMLLEFAAGVLLARLFIVGRLAGPVVLSCLLFAVGWALIFVSTATSVLLGCSFVVAGALHPRALALRQPLLKALGDASYSIYLTHLVALGIERSLWAKALPTPDRPSLAIGFVSVGLVASALLGYLVYVAVERPLTRWLNAKLSARNQARRVRIGTVEV
jgi:exopolysaccharide production protein ExoZ